VSPQGEAPHLTFERQQLVVKQQAPVLLLRWDSASVAIQTATVTNDNAKTVIVQHKKKVFQRVHRHKDKTLLEIDSFHSIIESTT
jgi:hypothetical protein